MPPSDVNGSDPAFYFKCDVNGAPLKIEAGVDDYYMFSSHYLDTNNVYVYKGELKQKNCSSNCNYRLAILINDYKVSELSAPMFPDSGLYVGNYSFNDGTPDPVEYNGVFTPLISGGATTYTWTYSDGQAQYSQQGVRKFKAHRTYSVSLALDSAGNTANHTNVFKIGSPLQANVTAIKQQGSGLNYNFYGASTISPASYSWNFGDGVTSNSITPNHIYASENYYTARLTLVSGAETCESYYQVPAFYNYRVHANYNNSFQPVPNLNRLSSITLVITDPNGNVYSSSSINQPTGSKVEIVSVEDFKMNSENEPTKKIKIKFSCQANSGSSLLNITNGEAVIAVSYK